MLTTQPHSTPLSGYLEPALKVIDNLIALNDYSVYACKADCTWLVQFLLVNKYFKKEHSVSNFRCCFQAKQTFVNGLTTKNKSSKFQWPQLTKPGEIYLATKEHLMHNIFL